MSNKNINLCGNLNKEPKRRKNSLRMANKYSYMQQ